MSFQFFNFGVGAAQKILGPYVQGRGRGIKSGLATAGALSYLMLNMKYDWFHEQPIDYQIAKTSEYYTTVAGRKHCAMRTAGRSGKSDARKPCISRPRASVPAVQTLHQHPCTPSVTVPASARLPLAKRESQRRRSHCVSRSHSVSTGIHRSGRKPGNATKNAEHSGHGTGGLIVRTSHAWKHFSSTAVRPRTPILSTSPLSGFPRHTLAEFFSKFFPK